MATVSDRAVGNFVKRPDEIIGKAITAAFRGAPMVEAVTKSCGRS